MFVTWDRLIVFRVVVYFINSFLVSDRNSRLNVESVQNAFQFAGTSIDEDEVECILANLIARVCFHVNALPFTFSPQFVGPHQGIHFT